MRSGGVGKGDRVTLKKNRTSNVSRATAEGEALLKEMGFEDKETPGRRRTRAAIRGDVYTPPAKKERKTAGTPGSGRRGRPPKKSEEKKEEPVAEEKEKKEDVDEKKESAAEEPSADGEAEEEKTE
ncbi:cilia- and flagella-associated protein 251-like isoform X3 [Homarus americanus]|uniref:cilia- and flagella-associated protein 251-like isoform X3 n=1 Tax=Homarus americanus TaxID=6706 RepID=UPI001C46F499|nr:cilia- and flagella-associated protein 251-like isoform X3 [Homarus americanus]